MIRVLASDGMNKAAAADLRAKGYEVVEQFYEPEDLKRELANYDVPVSYTHLDVYKRQAEGPGAYAAHRQPVVRRHLSRG